MSEAEQSFFQLCELESFIVDKYTIKHNLSQWKLTLSNYRMKDNLIEVTIAPPFTEMNLALRQKSDDPEFYEKNTAHLSIIEDHPDGTRDTIFTFDPEIEYLIFDTPYFYPHNWVTLFNSTYLYNKINHSKNYLKYLLQAYKDMFQSGIPLIHIKSARETRNHYEIDFILKEYLTISYVKTDETEQSVFFHLLLENAKKTQSDSRHLAKFHQIQVRYPRTIKNKSDVKFKFTANMI